MFAPFDVIGDWYTISEIEKSNCTAWALAANGISVIESNTKNNITFCLKPDSPFSLLSV